MGKKSNFTDHYARIQQYEGEWCRREWEEFDWGKIRPITLKKFWSILESTRKVSKNDPRLQEDLIVNELSRQPVAETFVFEEIYRSFTSELRYDDNLCDYLAKREVFCGGDDSWYYFCLGVIALGKKAFVAAITNRNEFVRLLKSGTYGSVRKDIGWEFYGMFERKYEEGQKSSEERIEFSDWVAFYDILVERLDNYVAFLKSI